MVVWDAVVYICDGARHARLCLRYDLQNTTGQAMARYATTASAVIEAPQFTAIPDLRSRLEDLPPELYDYIFSLTFNTHPSLRQIDSSYRPPHILQVDRTTRALAAKSYYGQGATFYCTNHEHCIRWLATLAPDHSQLLNEVRIESVSNLWRAVAANTHANQHRLFVTRKLSKYGVASDPRVLYFRTLGGDGSLNWTNCSCEEKT